MQRGQKILGQRGEVLKVHGHVEYDLSLTTGRATNMMWHPGAEHTLLCTLTLQEHVFVSDPDDPLVFRVVPEQGYVFKQGRELVIAPDVELIGLGLQGK